MGLFYFLVILTYFLFDIYVCKRCKDMFLFICSHSLKTITISSKKIMITISLFFVIPLLCLLNIKDHISGMAGAVYIKGVAVTKYKRRVVFCNMHMQHS